MRTSYKSKKSNDSCKQQLECDFLECDEVPRKMTIEQLRKHKEYENVCESEAEHIIETLHKLSILAYFYYTRLDNNA